MEVLPKKELISDNSEKRAELIRVTFDDPTRKALLDEINKRVEKNGWTFDYFTVIDFFNAEMGFKLSGFFPELLERYYPLLVTLREKFMEIESIKKYYESERFIKDIGHFNASIRWKGCGKEI